MKIAIAALMLSLAGCSSTPDSVRCLATQSDGGCLDHVVCDATACPSGETEVTGTSAGTCANRVIPIEGCR